MANMDLPADALAAKFYDRAGTALPFASGEPAVPFGRVLRGGFS